MVSDAYDLCRDDLERLIDQWIVGKSAERNRAIMRRRLIDGVCYEPLAEEFDMSVRQVQNIVYRCENKLIRHI